MSFFRRHTSSLDVPTKANNVLNVLFLLIVFIVVRVWHLTVIQYDERVEKATRPQRRVMIERAERATIRDRFNVPLAVNNVQYNVAISYAQIRELPRVIRRMNDEGESVRVYRRKEHVEQLSQLLGKELRMDSEEIEDIIYAKAALLPHVPCLVKEGVSEECYYRLKMREREWLGLVAERVPVRSYPQGRVASHLVGYMGAINAEEYHAIVREIRSLRSFLKEYDEMGLVSLPEGITSPREARLRLEELEERAYSINDRLGKDGIEAQYEEELRGFRGKKTFISDAQGNFLKELPGSSEPLSGQRLLLTISSELQSFTEQLLALNEEIREGRSIYHDITEGTHTPLPQPWIKGGAIVVMEPTTGEILALASTPRYDPNDFVAQPDDASGERLFRVRRWLENEQHRADLWDRRQPLLRERFSLDKGECYDEALELTWDNYLSLILPADHPLHTALHRFHTLSDAITLLRCVEDLRTISDHDSVLDLLNVLYGRTPHTTHRNTLSKDRKEQLLLRLKEYPEEVSQIKSQLSFFFRGLSHNYDKLLFCDLVRLLIDESRFPQELVEAIGTQSLSSYREATTHLIALREVVRTMTCEVFHNHHFSRWLETEKKPFLKAKRAEERRKGTYHRPFTDLFRNEEKRQFQAFWKAYEQTLLTSFLLGVPLPLTFDDEVLPVVEYFLSWHRELHQGAHRAASWYDHYRDLAGHLSLLSPSLGTHYIATMRAYKELNRPLWGRYQGVRKNQQKQQLEKHLAMAFYPVYGFGYGRSFAYRQVAPLGSTFKLVTAYAALSQQYQRYGPLCTKEQLNPLIIIDYPHPQQDSDAQWNVGYTRNRKPIPQWYKGGRLLRSARNTIGRIDLVTALETSSNPYFSLLAGDVLEDPEELNRAAALLSFGEKTGIDLPGEAKGRLAKDLRHNRTGLYANACGQHTLVVTPLQTACMLAALANGGQMVTPHMVTLMAGKEPLRGNDLIYYDDQFALKESLALAGVTFPLFTEALFRTQQNNVSSITPTIQRTIDMPPLVREMILEGMEKVVTGPQGCAHIKRVRNYYNYPDARHALRDLHGQFVAKTGTAEKVEHGSLDLETGTHIYKHIWFGGISFEKDGAEEGQSAILFDDFGKPELVVVVFLQYGDFGREAAPPAAQIIHKWREIKSRYETL